MLKSRWVKLTVYCGVVEGRSGGVGPDTQSVPLALCRHRSADPHVCFLSMVAWCQTVSAKKNLSKVQWLACLVTTGAIPTTPTGAMEALIGLSRWNRRSRGRRSRRHIASRVWGAGLTFSPNDDLAAYWLGFRSLIPYLIWGSTLWSQS